MYTWSINKVKTFCKVNLSGSIKIKDECNLWSKNPILEFFLQKCFYTEMQLYKRMFTVVYYMIIITAITTQEVI